MLIFNQVFCFYRMMKDLVKDQFKDSFEAIFEHLANDGEGGKVRTHFHLFHHRHTPV